MKKVLLVVAIVSIVAFILFLLFALLNMHAYHNLFDGTAEHYKWLHQRMIISFIIAIIFAVIGTVCFIIKSKL